MEEGGVGKGWGESKEVGQRKVENIKQNIVKI